MKQSERIEVKYCFLGASLTEIKYKYRYYPNRFDMEKRRCTNAQFGSTQKRLMIFSNIIFKRLMKILF